MAYGNMVDEFFVARIARAFYAKTINLNIKLPVKFSNPKIINVSIPVAFSLANKSAN